MGKTERLHELEQILISRPQGCKVADLARQLSVHRSQVYRYLDDIGRAGVPVVHDETSELWWVDTTRYLSHLRLSAEESLVLFLAARRLIRQTHAAVPVILTALAKLAQALRQPMAQQLQQVTEQRYNTATDSTRSQVWQALTQGWVEQRAVEITHRKFQNPVAQHYTLHPYLFEPSVWGESTYVIGYCPERDDLRTFKVERIEQARLTSVHFDIPPDLEADQLLQDSWGIWYDDQHPPVHIKVRFSPDVAQRVRETMWHPSQKLTDLSDGGLYWEIDVAEVRELTGWIRSWGPDAEVLEPETLRQRIADEFKKAAALYG